MTVSDLHDYPILMTKFMEWPYEDDEVVEYGVGGNWPHQYRTTTRRQRTADEATRERYDELLRQQRSEEKARREQTHLNFIQECARESMGVTGRTIEEIRRKCIALRPDIFSEDGNFAVPADTPPLPKRLK